MPPLRHKHGTMGTQGGKTLPIPANCEGLFYRCCWSSCHCKVDYPSWTLELFSKKQAFHYYQGCAEHSSQATEIACAGLRVLQKWRLSSVVKYFAQRHTPDPWLGPALPAPVFFVCQSLRTLLFHLHIRWSELKRKQGLSTQVNVYPNINHAMGRGSSRGL